MRTLIVSSKNYVPILPTLGFIMLVFFAFPIVPATATEFEVGTQFGISRLISDSDDSTTHITSTRFPSGTFFDLGSSPTSLYATWFPNKQFAIGPEFSLGRTSLFEEYLGEEGETASITMLHLGVRASYFLLSHAESSPYIFGRASYTIGEESLFFPEGQALGSFGAGIGYQWRIGSAFVLRTEGQYQRLSTSANEFSFTSANEFSLTIGIGTRFGNSKSSTAEVPNTQ